MEILIAHVYEDSGALKCDIKGTGLLLNNTHGQYAVTCRHVIDPLLSCGQVVMIANCRKYVIPRNASQECILLANPQYHPNDSDSSFDIAVYKLNGSKYGTTPKPYDLDSHQKKLQLKLGDDVLFSGYPTTYLEANFSPLSDDPLAPHKIVGKLAKVPFHMMEINGFSRSIQGFEFAQNLGEEVVSSGMSGGAVMYQNTLLGLIVGTVNGTYSPDGISYYPVNGGAFVPIERVKETIECLN